MQTGNITILIFLIQYQAIIKMQFLNLKINKSNNIKCILQNRLAFEDFLSRNKGVKI